MILSIGGGVKIDTKTIVMVLDIEHVTESKRGQYMFSNKGREKIVVCDEQNIPLSAVVCHENEESVIYLTTYASKTLLKHLGAVSESERDDFKIWW